MRKSWTVLAAFILVLALGPSLTQAQVPDVRVRSTLWVFDHASGEGYRAEDLRWITGGSWSFATTVPKGYRPAQVRHAYGFDRLPEDNDGAGQVIAIVIPFHGTAASDLETFIRTFELKPMYGLPGTGACTVAAGPHPCFETIFATGTQPRIDALWSSEADLDTQWAHAIAPGADIALVEAATSSLLDLLPAVDFASHLPGVSVVSMSWGNPEFAVEVVLDPLFFNTPGVTYVAGSGDVGGQTIYPSASPFVVAVGGTTLPLDRFGNRTGPERGWSGSGGGKSVFEVHPPYQRQQGAGNQAGLARAIPDVAFNADPATGVAIFVGTPLNGQSGWEVVGGTSASGPQWAALTVLANQLRNAANLGNLSSNSLFDSPEYDAAANAVFYRFNYRDITSGTAGPFTAHTGWDFVTGLGSPRAQNLVAFLAFLTGRRIPWSPDDDDDDSGLVPANIPE